MVKRGKGNFSTYTNLHILRDLWHSVELRLPILVVVGVGRHAVAVREQRVAHSLGVAVVQKP